MEARIHIPDHPAMPTVHCCTGQSLHNNFAWALVGNFVFAVTHWGVIALLARTTSPLQVGHYALSLAICGPIAMLSNLQMRALLASDAGNEYRLQDYLGMMLLMVPVGLAAIATAGWVGGFGADALLVILLMGIAKNIESFSNICYGVFQRNRRLDLVGKSLILKGLGSFLAIGILVWATHSIAVGIVGIILVWFALFAVYDSSRVAEIRTALYSLHAITTWDATKLRKLFKLGLPLAVASFLLAFTTSVPNILVGQLLDETALGVFAALASLSWAGVPVINALGQALLPRLGACHSSGDMHYLRRLVVGAACGGMILGMIGILGAWLLGDWVIASTYGEDYLGHNDVLLWLMVAACLLHTSRFIGDALTAMRRGHTLLRIQALTLIAVIMGGYWVIPASGLLGMAKVLALSFGARALALLAYFSRATSLEVYSPGLKLVSRLQKEPRAA